MGAMPATTGHLVTIDIAITNRASPKDATITDQKCTYEKSPAEEPLPGIVGFIQLSNYSWGPAATRALPSSLPVYLVKFLMKRADRSFAFSSQIAGSA